MPRHTAPDGSRPRPAHRPRRIEVSPTPNAPERLENVLDACTRVARSFGLTEALRTCERIARDLQEPLYLMVVGAGKAGKSHLINGLVGRDVAEVGIQPMTWTVEVFRNDPKRAGTAELFFESRPTPTVLSADEARAELEKLRPRSTGVGAEDPSTYRSDLYQVTWWRDLEWPPQDIGVVDTGGYGQERGAQRAQVALFNAQGMTATLAGDFDVWIERADVVLWCVNGLKVEHRETQDRIREIAAQRDVHVVLTRADRVRSPEERERVQARARTLYGDDVKSWSWAGLASKDEGASIRALRTRFEDLMRSDLDATKRARLRARVSEQRSEIVAWLRAYREFLTSNQTIASAAIEGIEAQRRSARAAVEAALTQEVEAAVSAARTRLEAHYDQAGGADAFAQSAHRVSLDPALFAERLRNRVNEEVAAFGTRVDQTLCGIDWQTTHMQDGAASRATWRVQRSHALIPVRASSHGVREVAHTGQGDSEGAAVGVAAGVVATLLLGPVGLLAAGVGFLVSGAQKRSRLVGEAVAAARTAAQEIADDSATAAHAALEASRRGAVAFVREAFAEVTGVPLDQLPAALERVDEARNGELGEEALRRLSVADGVLVDVGVDVQTLSDTGTATASERAGAKRRVFAAIDPLVIPLMHEAFRIDTAFDDAAGGRALLRRVAEVRTLPIPTPLIGVDLHLKRFGRLRKAVQQRVTEHAERARRESLTRTLRLIDERAEQAARQAPTATDARVCVGVLEGLLLNVPNDGAGAADWNDRILRSREASLHADVAAQLAESLDEDASLHADAWARTLGASHARITSVATVLPRTFDTVSAHADLLGRRLVAEPLLSTRSTFGGDAFRIPDEEVARVAHLLRTELEALATQRQLPRRMAHAVRGLRGVVALIAGTLVLALAEGARHGWQLDAIGRPWQSIGRFVHLASRWEFHFELLAAPWQDGAPYNDTVITAALLCVLWLATLVAARRAFARRRADVEALHPLLARRVTSIWLKHARAVSQRAHTSEPVVAWRLDPPK